jgi:hypothetical protein
VITKNSIFWGITPGGSLKVVRRFGGIFRLHLQGRKVRQARNRQEASGKQSEPRVENQAWCGPGRKCGNANGAVTIVCKGLRGDQQEKGGKGTKKANLWLFNPENGGDIFLRNVTGCLLNYGVLQPRISCFYIPSAGTSSSFYYFSKFFFITL